MSQTEFDLFRKLNRKPSSYISYTQLKNLSLVLKQIFKFKINFLEKNVKI